MPAQKKEKKFMLSNRENEVREKIQQPGIVSKSFVFIDESEFEDNQDCIYAWSKKGKKVYVEQERKRGKRENLVAGRRKKLKDLIPPIIFKGSLNALEFEQWLFQHLLPSLKISSVLRKSFTYLDKVLRNYCAKYCFILI